MPLTSRFNVHKCTWHTYFLFTHAFSTLGSFSEILNFCLCSRKHKTFMERTLRGEQKKDLFWHNLSFCVKNLWTMFLFWWSMHYSKLPRDSTFCFMSITTHNNKTFLFQVCWCEYSNVFTKSKYLYSVCIRLFLRNWGT